jgi:hypothetical protein
MANELNISTFMQGDAKRSGLYTEGVIGLDANSNKLINDMANTYVAKKEQLYNQWEDAYKTALTAANTTQGAFYKDLPELQTEGKALNKWIVENRGILTADGAIKNPQLYQEFLARMGDYSSKYEAAKANSVVNNKFKEALNDPQKYDAQATKILYDNWINGDIDYRAKNPYMPQVSVTNMFDNEQKKGIVENSKFEIKPEMQVIDKDKGTAFYSQNDFYSKEQMYNNLNQTSGGALQQRYEAYGKNSGKTFNEWVESQVSSIAPSSKTVQLGDKTYYVVPKEGQFRENLTQKNDWAMTDLKSRQKQEKALQASSQKYGRDMQEDQQNFEREKWKNNPTGTGSGAINSASQTLFDQVTSSVLGNISSGKTVGEINVNDLGEIVDASGSPSNTSIYRNITNMTDRQLKALGIRPQGSGEGDDLYKKRISKYRRIEMVIENGRLTYMINPITGTKVDAATFNQNDAAGVKSKNEVEPQ